MSYQSERDEFLSIMGSEGIRADVARTLLREATGMQRRAELSCSSEAADRDQVKCPGLRPKQATPCLCMDYGSFDTEHSTDAKMIHGTVPRYMVKDAAAEQRVTKLCAAHGLVPHFGGDPRGCILLVGVPSGKTNDWGQRGIAVPAQGYTAAQIDRISR